MSLAQILSTYITFNLLVAVGYITLRTLNSAALRFSGARHALKINYLILLAIFFATAVQPWFPHKPIFEPTARVWSAHSIKSFAQEYAPTNTNGYLSLPKEITHHLIDADRISLAIVAIFTISLAFGIVTMARDLWALYQIRRKSHLLRRIGRVSIYVNDSISVPFSYRTLSRAEVVVTSALLINPLDLKIAFSHELQHHRQSDTSWVYGLWILRIICALNPFVYLWSAFISELQEFACDETLVDRKKVESQQYARCLVEVAETAFHQKRLPVCATGLVFLVERNLLKRRIERMISSPKIKKKRSISWAMAGLSLTVVAATALASQGVVQDRRVSLVEAQKMADNSKGSSEFPIVVNDLVLKQLNRYIGTPEGRDFMRQSLQRMKPYQSMIESKIKEYDVPSELMAIPIIESGYQNLEANNQHGRGAGLWMFIASTARKFGLRVDDKSDDRLNTDVLSDAAMRMLKSNRLQFNDWLLAVLAYNVGEGRVEKAMTDTGSKDAWILVRKGYQNDRDYLPSVMAAILIMKNPESVL